MTSLVGTSEAIVVGNYGVTGCSGVLDDFNRFTTPFSTIPIPSVASQLGPTSSGMTIYAYNGFIASADFGSMYCDGSSFVGEPQAVAFITKQFYVLNSRWPWASPNGFIATARVLATATAQFGPAFSLNGLDSGFGNGWALATFRFVPNNGTYHSIFLFDQNGNTATYDGAFPVAGDWWVLQLESRPTFVRARMYLDGGSVPGWQATLTIPAPAPIQQFGWECGSFPGQTVKADYIRVDP